MFIVSVCFLSVSYAGVFQTSMEQAVLIKRTVKITHGGSKLDRQFETTCQIWQDKIVIKKEIGSVTTSQTQAFLISSENNEFEQNLSASLEGPHTLSRPSTNVSAYSGSGEEIATTYHVNVPREGNKYVTEMLFQIDSPAGSSVKKNSAAADFLVKFLDVNCSSN